jgi:ParB-like chromosome segregation protein Spo0J
MTNGERAESRLSVAQTPRIEFRSPGSLRPNPRNARTHSKKQIRQIANSIKAAGFVGAVIVDEADLVLAGHGRLKAAELLGMDLVPTLKVAGLSEAQKRAFVLADNKLCENAGWNRELLEHFPIYRNRKGFPCGANCDSP